MTDHWIVTVMGYQQPDCLRDLANLVFANHGDWRESRVIEMGGRFAAILSVVVPRENSASLQSAIEDFADRHELSLHLSVSQTEWVNNKARFRLKMTANNRRGLVHKVADIANQVGLQLDELITWCEPMPFGNEELFYAEIIASGSAAGMAAMKTALESLGDDVVIEEVHNHADESEGA